MATDTWWHGQKLWFARMGAALWPTRLDLDGRLGPVSGKTVYTSDSNRTIWVSSDQTRWLQPWTCAGKERPSTSTLLLPMLLATILLVQPSAAVFINFENCLSPNMIKSDPLQLQFVPLYVWAVFNSTIDSHGLNVTVYGNVTGSSVQAPIPAYDDPSWLDPKNDTDKIPDLGGSPGKQLYTTFGTQFNVLDYTPYNPDDVRFCNSSTLTACPIAPVHNRTITE
jgi:hypothetical protein